MKKLLSLVALLALAASPSLAAIGTTTNAIVWFNSPTTMAIAISGYCNDGNLVIDLDSGITYQFHDCASGGTVAQFFPVLESNVTGLSTDLAGKLNEPSGTTSQYLRGDGSADTLATGVIPESGSNLYFTNARAVSALTSQNVSILNNDAAYLTPSSLSSYLQSATAASTYATVSGVASTYLTQANAASTYLTQANAASTYATQSALSSGLAGKYNTPAGTTSQYVRGDGSLATLPTVGSRSWASPSRALASCFQIDSAKDADFHYKVDVASGTLLSGTVTGTVTVTSYTNSGCTTGAQVEADGQASQGAALGILSVSQVASVSLDGTLKGGKWVQITTANTSGTPTFTIRAAQREVTQP